MADPLQFYFDFSSPYGYFASEKIDALAARYDRQVIWKPFLLGVVFKETGAAPLTEIPLKSRYFLRDFARSARFMDVPFNQPKTFPLPTQHAARAFYWLDDKDPALARAFAQATLRAYFVDGVDISEQAVVQEIAVAQSPVIDRDALAAALAGAEVKERLKEECREAINKGVFGSPFVFVDEEPFFGADRLPQVERWLKEKSF